jgi:hypothetical protein
MRQVSCPSQALECPEFERQVRLCNRTEDVMNRRSIPATVNLLGMAFGIILLSGSSLLAEPQAPPVPKDPAATPATTSVRLYMPDGQLKSHRLRVYVTGTVLASQNPRLRLFRGHAITAPAAAEEDPLEPTFVASGQQWTESIDGREVGQSGTILLFDGRKIPFGAKAMVRVRPALTWTEGGTERTVLGPREINVGSIVFAVIWTATVVVLAVLMVIVLSWRKGSSPVLLLTGGDGHLSLAQAQVACWTVFVGSVVLGYGLIRLEIPEIPESLLVLMGASLVTGGVAYFQDAKRERDAVVTTGVAASQRSWAWGDLVRIFVRGQPPELSLAKAQMLFWTVLLLVLFVSKSVLEGRIWEVPWALVALMGFSQAGYLAPKLAPPVNQVPTTPPEAVAPAPTPAPAIQPANAPAGALAPATTVPVAG